MKSKLLATGGCIALVAMLGTNTALGALDAYLKVAGIDGELTLAPFAGWSDVLGYNISVQNPGWSSSSGGTLKPTLSPMFVQKYVDKASPRFFGGVLALTHYPTASIDVRHAGTAQTKMALWEFEDVVISAYSTGQFSDAAVESVALDYRKIKYTYWPQLSDGSAGTPVFFQYDRQSGTSALTGSGSLAEFELVTTFAAGVPEPSSIFLLASGLSAIVFTRRRRKHVASQASRLLQMRA